MLTDLQKRKLTRAFQFADTDRDGELEKSDYEAYAANIAAAFSTPLDSAAYAGIQAQAMQDWEGTRQLIARGDDKVSLDEWLAFYDGVINSPMVDMLVNNYVSGSLSLWQTADPSGPADGVNMERFTKFYSVFGLDAAAARASFDKMDTDHDGLMGRAEMMTAMRDFFTSDDPDAGGNWFLGDF